MSDLLKEKLKRTYLKLLKAEVKKKLEKVERLEKKMIQLEIELKNIR